MNRTKKICIAAAALLLILGIAGSIFIYTRKSSGVLTAKIYQDGTLIKSLTCPPSPKAIHSPLKVKTAPIIRLKSGPVKLLSPSPAVPIKSASIWALSKIQRCL